MDAATISSDGRYVYRITHAVGPGTQVACFVLAHTRHAEDPSLRERCAQIAAKHHCGIVRFVGLFAHRTMVDRSGEAIGPDNAREIAQAVQDAALVVAAWGEDAGMYGTVSGAITGPLRFVRLMCLSGEPLYERPLKLYRGGACLEP